MQAIAGISATTGTPATDGPQSNGRDASRDDCYNNEDESYTKDSKSRNAKSAGTAAIAAPQQYLQKHEGRQLQ
jgi:hypothetical protein